jgi:hypothetical protein
MLARLRPVASFTLHRSRAILSHLQSHSAAVPLIASVPVRTSHSTAAHSNKMSGEQAKAQAADPKPNEDTIFGQRDAKARGTHQ